MEPLRRAIVEGRKRKGWTQEEAAEAVGVSVRGWRYLEAGGMVTLPQPDRWRKLTELLEVKGHDLLVELGYVPAEARGWHI
jgi:transcriptional regulator with XRE-family HTH domain